MGVVTEICVKYPGGPTRITGTDLYLYQYNGNDSSLHYRTRAGAAQPPRPLCLYPGVFVRAELGLYHQAVLQHDALAVGAMAACIYSPIPKRGRRGGVSAEWGGDEGGN